MARDLARGRLARAASRTELVGRVECRDARVDVLTVSWSEYWGSVPPQAERPLRRLHSLWEAAITSATGADATLRQAYDDLLTTAITTSNRAFLRRVVAFESFEIVGEVVGERCAGIFTGRHPMLASAGVRASFRNIHDRLPVIATGRGDAFDLYSSYRQHRLPAPGPMSLATYLPANSEALGGAYALLRRVVPILSDGRDPFARERARRFAHQIIEPLLRCFELGVASATGIDFIDVGMGQGDLVTAVARELGRTRAQIGLPPLEISVWGTDLRPGSLRGQRPLTHADAQPSDYRRWIQEALPRIPERRPGVLRIALLSKVLDALTSISIRPGRAVDSDRTNDLSLLGPGIRSGYLCAAAIAAGTHAAHDAGMPCVAVREPNMSALEVAGSSIIDRLANRCDFLVIEDPDIGAAELQEHHRRLGLSQLVGFDLSARWSLRSHCVVVARQDRLRANPGGARIW